MNTDKVTSCEDCGLCCMGQNLVPGSDTWIARLSGEDPPRIIPPELMEELDTIVCGPCGGSGDEPCWWLNRATGRCQHYEFRPDVCREFEVGSEACLKCRKLANVETPQPETER